MKTKILLAPFAAMAAAALFAGHADAISVCQSGTEPADGNDHVVECAGNLAKGRVGGDEDGVFAALDNGPQLDVRGLNQDNQIIKQGCGARDTIDEDGGRSPSRGDCVPDEPNEVMSAVGYDLYRN